LGIGEGHEGRLLCNQGLDVRAGDGVDGHPHHVLDGSELRGEFIATLEIALELRTNLLLIVPQALLLILELARQVHDHGTLAATLDTGELCGIRWRWRRDVIGYKPVSVAI